MQSEAIRQWGDTALCALGIIAVTILALAGKVNALGALATIGPLAVRGTALFQNRIGAAAAVAAVAAVANAASSPIQEDKK